jgi:hypothetical protein
MRPPLLFNTRKWRISKYLTVIYSLCIRFVIAVAAHASRAMARPDRSNSDAVISGISGKRLTGLRRTGLIVSRHALRRRHLCRETGLPDSVPPRFQILSPALT